MQETRTKLQSSSGEQGTISPPAISLPKGGGAIRGMGEKFAANPVTGTGSLSVPIYTSPGRAGFGPQLSLSYDSGAGNGPFGFGWTSRCHRSHARLTRDCRSTSTSLNPTSLSYPAPKTSFRFGRGRRPMDAPGKQTGGQRPNLPHPGYRPRIEGSVRAHRTWTNEAIPSDTYWRSISKDNVTIWYGKTAASRIADPADPTRIFTWLICESYDDKGNVIVYDYKPENSDGYRLLRPTSATAPTPRAGNRYIKRSQIRQPRASTSKPRERPAAAPTGDRMAVRSGLRLRRARPRQPEPPTPLSVDCPP